MDSKDENPWGILTSLEDGYVWLEKLENELIEISYDLITHKSSLTSSSQTLLEYGFVKTKEAIEIIEIEMKMFKG